MLLFIVVVSCTTAQEKKEFTSKGLQDKLLTLEGNEIAFSEILEKHKGKKIMLEVWASWCSDCIKGMPKLKEMQNKSSEDVVYLFLSLDRSIDAWKAGIDKHDLNGNHYFLRSGWKGDFCKSIDLDWIPRYMVVNPLGEITVYKAIKATEPSLLNAVLK